MRLTFLSLLGLAALSSAAAAQSTPLRADLVYSGYARPLALVPAPGDDTRLFVMEQKQHDIHVIHNGVQIVAPFLDLTGLVFSTGNEQGLLGLAFHPDYQNNGFFYVNYTTSGGGLTRIARYTRSLADANLADAGSAVTILEYSQPQSNHNGGGLVFGPDGYLWIATGDGGNANDTGAGHATGGNAQAGATLLGKMLRIDIDGDDFPADPNVNYAIPASNPYVADPNVRDEVIYLGLRNPWRYTFDRETGDLFIGDVGQDAREEIDFIPAAEINASAANNLGWRCTEGFQCTGLSGCTCGDVLHTAPIKHYAHTVGQSVTGGYVYRGDAIPDLYGTYFYADYQASKIFSLRYDGVTVTEDMERTAELDPAGTLAINGPASFGQDNAGELYILDLTHGEIFKIVPDGPFLGLGEGYAGVSGKPRLHGTGGVGNLEAGGLHIRNAVPNKLAVAWASLTENPVPFFGGTLVPGLPMTLSLNLSTNPNGEINLNWANLGANPPGLEIFMQFGFDDPAANFGVALSNALVATIP